VSDAKKAAKVIPLTRIKCPNCSKRAVLEFKPFCSKRCADLDLGKWLDGGYRIATEEEANLEDFQAGEQEE